MLTNLAVGVSLLGAVARVLRAAGDMRLPRELPLFDRAALGLETSLWRIGTQADWGAAFEEIVATWETDGLESRQEMAWDGAR